MFKKMYSSINTQILYAVLIVSSCITFMITIFQLYADFRGEIAGIEKNFALMEKTYKQGLETAVWNFDFQLLEIQTSGILNIPGFTYIEIREGDKIIHKNGIKPSQTKLSFKSELTHGRSNDLVKTKIGIVEIWGDLDAVYSTIGRKIGITLLIQFLKTFLVSTAIFILLNRILTKHLLTIKSHMLNSIDMTKEYVPLKLKRSPQFQDELYSLTESINRMLKTSHENFKSIGEFNLSLENQVRERSQVITDQQNQLMLSAKLSSLGEMAGGIAHEINTPLTVISLLAEQTIETEGKAQVVATQQRILATVQKISKIISSLKFLVRDSVKEGIEEVSLKFLLDETLALCSFKLNQCKVKLTIDTYEEIKLQCRAVQISLVLVNLIRNSIDAVENLSEKWIKISIKTGVNTVQISVMDSGSGIPADVIEKMFLPFYSTKSIGKGTGLGLSISYNMIANHQGTLKYNNSSGHTEFIIEIPFVTQPGLLAS